MNDSIIKTPQIKMPYDTVCHEYDLSLIEYHKSTQDSVYNALDIKKDWAMSVLASALLCCIVGLVLIKAREKEHKLQLSFY